MSTYLILMISGVVKIDFFPQTTKPVLLTLNISDNASQSPKGISSAHHAQVLS